MATEKKLPMPTPIPTPTPIRIWVSPNGTHILTEDGCQPIVIKTVRLCGTDKHTVYSLFMGHDVFSSIKCLEIERAHHPLALTCITPSVMLDILRTVDPTIALSVDELLAMTKPTIATTYHAVNIKLYEHDDK